MQQVQCSQGHLLFCFENPSKRRFLSYTSVHIFQRELPQIKILLQKSSSLPLEVCKAFSYKLHIIVMKFPYYRWIHGIWFLAYFSRQLLRQFLRGWYSLYCFDGLASRYYKLHRSCNTSKLCWSERIHS